MTFTDFSMECLASHVKMQTDLVGKNEPSKVIKQGSGDTDGFPTVLLAQLWNNERRVVALCALTQLTTLRNALLVGMRPQS